MTPAGQTSRASVALVIGSLSAIVLIVHARSYLPLVVDDAYISLRYAMRFLQGEGLTWSDGEAVEGYSNLLWVLGCALLGSLGLDLVTAARTLGLLCATLTIAALLYVFAPRTWAGSLPALAGSLFIALAGPIAIWSVAGLEACMVAALLAWGLLMPTLLDYTKVSPPKQMDGRSLMPLVRKDGPVILPEHFMVETEIGRSEKIGVYTPAWKFIENRKGHEGVNPIELQAVGTVENGAKTDVGSQHANVMQQLAAFISSWERAHPKSAPVKHEEALSPTELEQLRALGYIE